MAHNKTGKLHLTRNHTVGCADGSSYGRVWRTVPGWILADCTYLAVRISSVPLSFSSLSFSKYISRDCRRTNQRFFQFLLDSVDDPPPFLCSQPCLSASCLERNHKKVSSFRTHQRRFHVLIKPPATEHGVKEDILKTRHAKETEPSYYGKFTVAQGQNHPPSQNHHLLKHNQLTRSKK